MERALGLGLVLVGYAAALCGCDGWGSDTATDDESTAPTQVVSAASTKVVITDRTEPDAGAGCSADGQIYTIDLRARTLAYSVCRFSRPALGSRHLTADEAALVQQKLDAVYLVETDTGATGYTVEDYLEIAITTDGTTRRYVDIFHAEENGYVNTVSGAVDVLLEVETLVDGSQGFIVADASVGSSADGGADVQLDANVDAPGDAGSDAALNTDVDAH